MFTNFFFELRKAHLPVSLKEYLMLLEAVKQGLAEYRVDDFYYLSRSALVKDERHLDKFDRVFGHVFKGMEMLAGLFDQKNIPEEWLRKMAELHLSEEEKAEIEAMGGWEELMEQLKKRLEEQQGRHQGGNKWIGTAGKSPYGAYGYNPEGVRIGQDGNRNFSAVKVWDKRDFKNLDDSVELGTRNIKVALRKLRKFAREGAAEELDLPDTITSTAKQGWLDIKMVPERHNAVKVLIFFDVGGSMSPHVKVCEEIFSAVRSEFKHLEYFYFHNCLYDHVWRDNRRRNSDPESTWDVLHTYGSDYKVIFVGDASMSPYEVTMPGGSVEYWNEEAGEVWLHRLVTTFSNCVWLNPIPKRHWGYTPSVGIIGSLFEHRMFELTIEGLDSAIKELRH